MAPGRVVQQRARIARGLQRGTILYGAVDDGDDFDVSRIQLLCQRLNGLAHIFAFRVAGNQAGDPGVAFPLPVRPNFAQTVARHARCDQNEKWRLQKHHKRKKFQCQFHQGLRA